MLPFGAQGSNQALEDAGALGELFKNIHSPELVPERLALFDHVRRLRASRVQTLSRVRLGKEMEVQAQLQQFADPAGGGTCLRSFPFLDDPHHLSEFLTGCGWAQICPHLLPNARLMITGKQTE